MNSDSSINLDGLSEEPHLDDVRMVMDAENCLPSQAIELLKEHNLDPIEVIYGKSDLIICTSCGFEYSPSEIQLDEEFIHRNWICSACEFESDSDESDEVETVMPQTNNGNVARPAAAA